jgi:hypothetical protein
MRILLMTLLLLGLVADKATAQPTAVARRVSDTSVIILLPQLPEGSEYHEVWITCDGYTDRSPKRYPDGRPGWEVNTQSNSGEIAGILCTQESCTPFKVYWVVENTYYPDDLVDPFPVVDLPSRRATWIISLVFGVACVILLIAAWRYR